MSIADHVVQESRAAGLLPLGVEGENSADWIVVDLGDVIVHVMQEESRRLYELEKTLELMRSCNLSPWERKCRTGYKTGFLPSTASFSERYALELIEIPAGKRGKNADIKRILDKEVSRCFGGRRQNRIVTLDIPKCPDTPQLAAELERWKLDGRDVSLLDWRA